MDVNLQRHRRIYSQSTETHGLLSHVSWFYSWTNFSTNSVFSPLTWGSVENVWFSRDPLHPPLRTLNSNSLKPLSWGFTVTREDRPSLSGRVTCFFFPRVPNLWYTYALRVEFVHVVLTKERVEFGVGVVSKNRGPVFGLSPLMSE